MYNMFEYVRYTYVMFEYVYVLELVNSGGPEEDSRAPCSCSQRNKTLV